MKAMILAAGLGTRLLPYTKHTPKPLFTLSGQPILEHIIQRLQKAGCEEIIINTHHLHDKIEGYIASNNCSFPIHLKHEPTILGTGGAIKNASDLLNNKPFILINSDIVSDIDLRRIYDFHLTHNHPITMVMHDYPEFNNVSVNTDNCVIEFHSNTSDSRIAFTGIHVMDPEIFDFIPDGQFYSIIDAYRDVILNGQCVKTFIIKDHYWKDIGTPEAYKQASFDIMASKAFQHLHPDYKESTLLKEPIQGDGSDRIWYRASSDGKTLIAVDHGIRQSEEIAEVDSFVNIGKHLHKKNLPVPEIYQHDTFSGLVFLQDLGSTHLQDVILNLKLKNELTSHYQTIIHLIGDFSISGANDFNTSWTYQSTHYDKDLILEKECRYFVEAFLQNYLGMDVKFDDLQKEFSLLADKALENAVYGLMHRDMQSRNIMVKNDTYYFIDFQGARLGPVQYDLASLIIDPYVALPLPIQSRLIDFSVETLSDKIGIKKDNFRHCLNYCFITRNLQILGAFGYLSKVKGKKYFEQYIPTAIKTLKHNLTLFMKDELLTLKTIINECGSLKSSSQHI
jgi:NDP-sugar pyrophosphorylase family protein